MRDLRDPPLPYAECEFVHEDMRPADLTLIKDVFIHLDDDTVIEALKRLKTTLLLTTTYPPAGEVKREVVRGYAPLNLAAAHYGLGEPVALFPECRPGKFLGLWVLNTKT